MRRSIKLHSARDIEMSRRAALLAADVLSAVTPHVKAGVTTNELDKICHDRIVNVHKATAANIGYHGFPKTICASINDVVCHGIPSNTVLKDGDILNIDVAVIKDGWFGDTSRMYFVGEPSTEARRLVSITYDAMCAGIRAVRPGAALGDIGHAIQSVAHQNGYSVVREYCGHGIGRIYHDEPQVLHFGEKGAGVTLKPGMIFTIEPMLNSGKAAVKLQADQWTVVTKDRSLSAQWEHMIAVTEDGFDVLTAWPDAVEASDAANNYPPIR